MRLCWASLHELARTSRSHEEFTAKLLREARREVAEETGTACADSSEQLPMIDLPEPAAFSS